MTCCPRDYSNGSQIDLQDLLSGDILLTRDPAFTKAGACLAQGLLCWGVNHGGLAVDPAEFPPDGNLRTRMPDLEPGRKYMLHALVTGIRVWNLEDYLHRMIKKGPPTGAIFVRQLQKENRRRNMGDDFQAALVKAMDAVFGAVADKAYETNYGSMVAGYFDSCEGVCPWCSAKADDNSYFCSELMAEVLLKADVIEHDRPADEFMPTDFLESDGFNIEKTQFCDGISLGPVRALQLPSESIDGESTPRS